MQLAFALVRLQASSPSPAAVAYGVLAGTICNFATQFKFIFGYDDCLDIFTSHVISGNVDHVATALFAQFDSATVIAGG